MKKRILFILLIVLVCLSYACNNDSSNETDKPDSAGQGTDFQFEIWLALCSNNNFYYISIGDNAKYTIKYNEPKFKKNLKFSYGWELSKFDYQFEEELMLNEEQCAEIVELINSTPDHSIGLSAQNSVEGVPSFDNFVQLSITEKASNITKEVDIGSFYGINDESYEALIRKIVELSPITVVDEDEKPFEFLEKTLTQIKDNTSPGKVDFPYEIEMSLKLTSNRFYYISINKNAEFSIKYNTPDFKYNIPFFSGDLCSEWKYQVEEKFTLNQEQCAEIIECIYNTNGLMFTTSSHDSMEGDDCVRLNITNSETSSPGLHILQSLDAEAYVEDLVKSMQNESFIFKPESKPFVDLIKGIIELSPVAVVSKEDKPPRFMNRHLFIYPAISGDYE